MSDGSVIEYFPLQMLTLEDLQAILDLAFNPSPNSCPAERVKQEWQILVNWVQEALVDAFLRGPPSLERWVPRINRHMEEIEQQCTYEETCKIQGAFLCALDRVYGAIFRHVLRRMPTAIDNGQGYLVLDKITFYRYARLKDTEKPALEQIMELLFRGGPHFRLEFKWRAPVN